jgi:hypothetical protein
MLVESLTVAMVSAFCSKCTTNLAPKDPVWSDVPNWWDLNGDVNPVGRVGE